MRKIYLLGMALLAACEGGDVADPLLTPTPVNVTGSYQLTTVDGQSLPFLMLDLGAYQARLVSGTLTLEQNGSYSLELGHRIDDSGNVRTGTASDAGAWTIVGDSIFLNSTERNDRKAGTVFGKVMTLRASASVLVLHK